MLIVIHNFDNNRYFEFVTFVNLGNPGLIVERTSNGRQYRRSEFGGGTVFTYATNINATDSIDLYIGSRGGIANIVSLTYQYTCPFKNYVCGIEDSRDYFFTDLNNKGSNVCTNSDLYLVCNDTNTRPISMVIDQLVVPAQYIPYLVLNVGIYNGQIPDYMGYVLILNIDVLEELFFEPENVILNYTLPTTGLDIGENGDVSIRLGTGSLHLVSGTISVIVVYPRSISFVYRSIVLENAPCDVDQVTDSTTATTVTTLRHTTTTHQALSSVESSHHKSFVDDKPAFYSVIAVAIAVGVTMIIVSLLSIFKVFPIGAHLYTRLPTS